MIKYYIIFGLLFCLLGCLSEEALANYLLGSWQGVDQNRSWCVTYKANGDNYTVDIYSKTVAQLADENAANNEIIEQRLGYLLTDRGLRFMHNIALSHNTNGKLLPEDERKAKRSHYIIVNKLENSYTYQSTQNNKQYENQRVKSCNHYAVEFKKSLS